jgi:hypothetical protein
MALPKGVSAGISKVNNQLRPKQNGGEGLVAVSRADGNTLAADGTTTAQYSGAGFCLHTRAKAVRLGAMATVGLKCALRHKSALLLLTEKSEPWRQDLSISKVASGIQRKDDFMARQAPRRRLDRVILNDKQGPSADSVLVL